MRRNGGEGWLRGRAAEGGEAVTGLIVGLLVMVENQGLGSMGVYFV